MKMQWIFALVVALGFGGASRADVIDATPGLVYHLDASTGVTKSGTDVTAWVDKAGVYTFSQSTVAYAPGYVAGAINGHPALQWGGVDQLTTTASATLQTVIVVCETFSWSSHLGGMFGDTSSPWTGIRRTYENTGWYSVNSGDFTYGGAMSINGTPGYTQAINTVGIMVATASSAVAWSGTGLGFYDPSGGGTRYWSGYLAEVAVFSGTLTSAQISAIIGSLGTKYNVPVVVPEPASMMLLLGGGSALLACAWRKRK